MKHCSCGSKKNYNDCCGRFIAGKEIPQSPEELMRSRYTAYTQANMDYIIGTMKSPASDHFNSDEAKQWAREVKWLKLEVLKTSLNQSQAYVEFVAHFFHAHKKQFLHERSEFRFENGRWYYIDGIVPKSGKR